MDIVVGIDIGGTNTVIALIDRDGNVLSRQKIATPQTSCVETYICQIKSTIDTLLASENNPILKGIGVGAPNGNYHTGTIDFAPNLPFGESFPIVSLLQKKFPSLGNIILTNDANIAAMGEMVYGGARGMKNFLMFTLGTGLGSGLVVNKQLVYGHTGLAGEYGHTVLTRGGRECGCGLKGHAETYCSATGMVRTAFDIIANTAYYKVMKSPLRKWSYESMTSKKIVAAALEGDELAIQVVELTGKYLGHVLANSIHVLSPEAIFLFGGVVKAGDLLIKPTINSMESYLLPPFKQTTKVILSELKPGEAAVLGASALVWERVS